MSNADRRILMSNNDRSTAMDRLGQAMAEGRLTVDEYDARCATIASARFLDELAPLFLDLPDANSHEVEKTYTASELARARKASAYPRAGLFLLTSIAALAASGIADNGWVLLIIPAVFVLLYVMKVGPASWYTPTQGQLERQRIKELRHRDKLRTMQLRQQNRETRAELTSKAFKIARDQLDKRRG